MHPQSIRKASRNMIRLSPERKTTPVPGDDTPHPHGGILAWFLLGTNKSSKGKSENVIKMTHLRKAFGTTTIRKVKGQNKMKAKDQRLSKSQRREEPSKVIGVEWAFA